MNSGLASTLLLSLIGCHLYAQGKASSPTKADGPTSVSIVELFTSEGCSSCPPADDLLRRINLQHGPHGQLLVGLSEHVTYWNNLGWHDPYSQELFTERQVRYAARFGQDGPYTPQMVLNGRDQFVGSDVDALQKALRSDVSQTYRQVVIQSAERTGDGIDVYYAVRSADGAEKLETYAALTDDLDRSNVLRGENSGHALQHAAVVRSLSRIASAVANSETLAHIPFPANFDGSGNSGHHVVIFLQEPHQGSILGAAAITLP